MITRLSFIFILAFTVGFWPLISAAEMTIGGEIEFVFPGAPGKKAGVKDFGLKGYEESMAEIFAFELRERCQALGCTEEKVPGKWGKESRFIFGDDFWIQVSWDPSVLEILTKPLSLTDLRKVASRMQDAIFGTAELSGFTVSAKRAGHFNFGASASFENDAELFVKFVVDYANHPQLATGILRETNLMTAPPVAALSHAQRSALAALAKKDFSETSIAEASQLLIDQVFYKTVRSELSKDWAVHNQALGLKKLPDVTWSHDEPMEVRAIRSQESVEDLILLGELFQARIAYLKTVKVELAVSVSRPEPPKIQFTSQELVDSFYQYVAESGLAWDRFRYLLPEDLRPLRPLALKKRAMSCQAAF